MSYQPNESSGDLGGRMADRYATEMEEEDGGQEVTAQPPGVVVGGGRDQAGAAVPHNFSYSFEENDVDRSSFDIELVAEVPVFLEVEDASVESAEIDLEDDFEDEISTDSSTREEAVQSSSSATKVLFSEDEESAHPPAVEATGSSGGMKSAAKGAAVTAMATATAVAGSAAGKEAIKYGSKNLPTPVKAAGATAFKSAQKSMANIDTSSPPAKDKSAPYSPASTAAMSSPASTVHTIEVVQKRHTKSCFWLVCQKKYLIAFAVVALLGLTVWLLSEYLAIPGLDAQIEELESEVDRLSEQVDRLSHENDRFGVLNDEFEENNDEYSEQNDRLERSNAFYAELNNQLNASNMELLGLNQALNMSNAEYGKLNTQLTGTVDDLNGQVSILENVNSDLSATLLEYIKLNEGLSVETSTLDSLNADLTSNLLALNDSLENLRNENGKLNELLDDLGTIASFLSETSSGLEQSYDYIANYLAEQIVANRVILTDTLHNTYRQRTISWVCGLSIRFATEAFASDGTIVIGSALYPEVISYVADNVLSVLCLDVADFERYLSTAVSDPTNNANLNTIIMSVMMYSTDAMDYYFPDAGEVGGVTEQEWADASFRCENLSEGSQFLMA